MKAYLPKWQNLVFCDIEVSHQGKKTVLGTCCREEGNKCLGEAKGISKSNTAHFKLPYQIIKTSDGDPKTSK